MYKRKETAIKFLQDGESFDKKEFDLWRDDYDVVSEAVNNDPSALQYASESLRDDDGFISELAIGNIQLIEHCSERLKNDREIAKYLLDNYGRSYEVMSYLGGEILNDEEFMLGYLENEPHCLQYASDSIKDNKEVVIKLVSGNGYVLEYASDRLKNDTEVVLEAVKSAENIGLVIEHSSQRIQKIIENADPVSVLETMAIKERLEQKVALGVNLKSLSDLREEKGMTRKNKI